MFRQTVWYSRKKYLFPIILRGIDMLIFFWIRYHTVPTQQRATHFGPASPVLTCLGTTFAGRVAASLLRAIGLPELITRSLEEYEALALKLAHEPAFLAATKAKLAQNRETCPLFDTVHFTRHIEAAYVTMWERYQRREAPEAFTVAPIN